MRFAIGLLILVHALAHAVFPMRGVGFIEQSAIVRGVLAASWMVATVGWLFAAAGIMGARPFLAWRRGAAFAATLGSCVSLIGAADPLLWPGAVLDLLALGAVLLIPVPDASPRPALRALGSLLAIGIVGWYSASAALKPWYRTWGTTAAERAMPLPGDQPGRDPAYEVNRGVTVRAPPEAVWPWLAQLGQDRAGFYSYDRLERLFGVQIHNVRVVRPEWQTRAVGDLVPATQPGYLLVFREPVGWRVKAFELDRALVLANWGAFVLVPQRDGTTRLLVRSPMGGPRVPPWGAAVTAALLDLTHFVMEQKMLRTIRDLAEASVRAPAGGAR